MSGASVADARITTPSNAGRPGPRPWHALRAADVARAFGVDPARGLDAAEAAARLTTAGSNELEPVRRPSLAATTLRAVREPFVLLLAGAGLLALALGEERDGLFVLLGLVPIVGATVATEYRAERALEALRKAVAPVADVRRDGRPQRIPARDVVPGDVVLLRVGDVVAADARVIRSDALTLDRSVLTGESLPELTAVEPDTAGVPLPDRRSMAWAGTSVVLGRGEGVVVATGRSSELGRIAARLGTTDRGRSPLQRELDRLVRILLIVATVLIAVTVGAALLRGESPGSALLAGIAAAIAAIPEEPPVLLAVILGLGAYRLLRRNVLVRRLSAQETLGAVDLIITDKTGTITRNRLSLDAVVLARGRPAGTEERRRAIDDALRAEDDAWQSGPGVRTGSFTRALLAAAGRERVILERDHLLASTPPSDGRPYSWTRSLYAGRVEELALGAPEAVLGLLHPDDPDTADWRTATGSAARAGRRLLLLAGRPEGGSWKVRALLAFADELRPGIADALGAARDAGIQTVVVTGDHAETAAAIALAAGVSGGDVTTGGELDALDEDALARTLAGLRVVARATPEQKLRLVRAARRAGRTVAVTGDGVNDAPALQHADVGVAMGSGTEVAREAADLVLGDDSFVTLMGGLAEGRRIVANVEKGLVFLTSTHVALLGFILIATLAGFGHPLLPLQILWLELFIDLATSVAFEREPAEPDLMRRPPRPRNTPLLTSGLLLRIAFAGGITALAALVLMAGTPGSADHARWVAFNALVFGQIVRAWSNRSLRRSVTTLRRNGFLAVACLAAGAIQLGIPYVPPMADAFRASVLTAGELALVAGVAIAPALVAELLRRRSNALWVA